MDHQLSQNKLILLYLIREKENITPAELSDFVLFRGYMDYFTMQNYIAELLEAGLIVSLSANDRAYYTLHPQGEEVVELFRARIPHSIREEIRDYAQNSFLHGSPLLEVEAKIEKQAEEKYAVRCLIKDYDQTVMDVLLMAGSQEEAYQIRNNWQKKGMSVYWNLLRELNESGSGAAPGGMGGAK